jgi:hypothetical protein
VETATTRMVVVFASAQKKAFASWKEETVMGCFKTQIAEMEPSARRTDARPQDLGSHPDHRQMSDVFIA